MAVLRPLLWGALVGLSATVPLLPVQTQAQILTQEEALVLAFSETEVVQRRTAFLDEDQMARIQELAGPGVSPPSGIVTHYVALAGDEPTGVAYFDSHRVRTLNQVLIPLLHFSSVIREAIVFTSLTPRCTCCAPSGFRPG